MKETELMEKVLHEVMESFHFVGVSEIPRIELYMDQVLSFLQDNLSDNSWRSEKDKILTKAMINNYVKNKVLIPPVRKKYNTDHILLLVFISYMKNFLSIEDIRQIIAPLSARYAQEAPAKGDRNPEEKRQPKLTIPEIYTRVFGDVGEHMKSFSDTVEEMIEKTEETFTDEGLSTKEKDMLRRVDLICQLSADIYVRKLYIEKLLDAQKKGNN